MFRKKHKNIIMLSLAFAVIFSSVLSFGGQAEAASAMDMFRQVYKQASGTEFQGFGSSPKQESPQKPVESNPGDVSQPDPVETPQPEQPQQPEEVTQPEQPVAPQPEAKPEKPSNSSVADKILKSGEKYMGTPYKYGAPYGQTNTFDCSSFTKTVFAENGITLPRSSRQQAQVGKPISKSELQKGDLIFTSTSYSSSISHVAIYAGNGKVLHTYGPGGVRYDNFKGSWLDRAYITARRVIN